MLISMFLGRKFGFREVGSLSQVTQLALWRWGWGEELRFSECSLTAWLLLYLVYHPASFEDQAVWIGEEIEVLRWAPTWPQLHSRGYKS